MAAPINMGLAADAGFLDGVVAVSFWFMFGLILDFMKAVV